MSKFVSHSHSEEVWTLVLPYRPKILSKLLSGFCLIFQDVLYLHRPSPISNLSLWPDVLFLRELHYLDFVCSLQSGGANCAALVIRSLCQPSRSAADLDATTIPCDVVLPWLYGGFRTVSFEALASAVLCHSYRSQVKRLHSKQHHTIHVWTLVRLVCLVSFYDWVAWGYSTKSLKILCSMVATITSMFALW